MTVLCHTAHLVRSRKLVFLVLAALVAVSLSCGQGAPSQGSSNNETAQTGGPEVLWQEPLDGSYIWPPAVEDGVVYGTVDSTVFALDAATGKTHWRKDALVYPQSGPRVNDGRVYVSGAGGIRCLNAVDGSEIWWFFIPTDSMSTPVAGEDVAVYSAGTPVFGEGVLYASASDGYVHAIDSQTGQERWRFQVGNDAGGIPALSEGVLYVDGDDAVSALDAATGQEKWNFQKAHYSFAGSPVISDGKAIFADSQYIYALDAKTGAAVWRSQGHGDPNGPLLAVNGLVYVSAFSDPYWLSAFDTASGEVHWMLRSDEELEGRPVLAGSKVLLPAQSLWAIAPDTGEELWKFDLPTDQPGQGQVFAAAADGMIFASVCLERAYESGCVPGNSYIYAIRDSDEPSDGPKTLRAETPTPIAPLAAATPPPASTPRAPGATEPVLIDSPGIWAFSDLGYGDTILERTSGSIIALGDPPVRRLYAPALSYALPSGASEGPDLWYTLHLHFEAIVSDDQKSADNGVQDFTFWATAGGMPVFTVDFSTVWEKDRLVVDCTREFACNQTEDRKGDTMTVTSEGWRANLLPDAGVQPGVNAMLFVVPYDELPPRFQSLHIFADSYVEVSTKAPY